MSLIYIDFIDFFKLNTIFNLKNQKKAISNQKTLCPQISLKYTKNLLITQKSFGMMLRRIYSGLKGPQKF
jgi:hypothetical protein